MKQIWVFIKVNLYHLHLFLVIISDYYNISKYKFWKYLVYKCVLIFLITRQRSSTNYFPFVKLSISLYIFDIKRVWCNIFLTVLKLFLKSKSRTIIAILNVFSVEQFSLSQMNPTSGNESKQAEVKCTTSGYWYETNPRERCMD